MMLQVEMERRGIPDALVFLDGRSVRSQEDWLERRAELLRLFAKEMYGLAPDSPQGMTSETLEENKSCCAGKAVYSRVRLSFHLGGEKGAFQVHCTIPKRTVPVPAFVLLNFRPDVPDRYLPIEELVDFGYAVFSVAYQDIAPDHENGFTEGIGTLFFPDGTRDENDTGTIGLWAWGASRVMDYVQTLIEIDLKRVAVVGHSRLGKTALLAGARDDRFSCVISNDSGCGGAAISREKKGETVDDIVKRFPHWFCPRFSFYRENEAALPFDQHALLALIAPRRVYVASAKEDSWADPNAEYLACVAADPVFRLWGVNGFEYPDRWPMVGEAFARGRIGYHLRAGEHYLSREDWLHFVAYQGGW